jgi:hypothetical protein
MKAPPGPIFINLSKIKTLKNMEKYLDSGYRILYSVFKVKNESGNGWSRK